MPEQPPADRESDAAARATLSRVPAWLPFVVALTCATLAGFALAEKIKIDQWIVALLVIGVLVWFLPSLDTLKLPGGTEVKLRAIETAVRKTEAAKVEATAQAEHAEGAVEAVRRLEQEIRALRAQFPSSRTSGSFPRPGEMHLLDRPKGRPTEIDVERPIFRRPAEEPNRDELIREYEDVRADMPPGSARTQRMTEVMTRMIDFARDDQSADVDALLRDASKSGARRLYAYALIHARPDRRFIDPLIDALASGREEKPFGQYWALRALNVIGDGGPQGKPTTAQANRLEVWLRDAGIAASTDRGYEARRCIRMAQEST
jgi:hypothetical protein